MKLIKLSVFMVTVLSFSSVAMAVGPMEKSEIRAGTLICEGNGSGLKSGAVVNAAKIDDRREPANNKSAQ